MDQLVIASSKADAAAVTAIKEHHAQLAGALGLAVERLVTAAGRPGGTGGDTAEAGAALVSWCRRELLPHAEAEERSLYPAAHRMESARSLVDAMRAEHELIGQLVDAVDRAGDPVRAAADARALEVLFTSHLRKENEQVLPLLAASPEVALGELLDGMHELLGGQHDASDGCGCGCGCGGGEVSSPARPAAEAHDVSGSCGCGEEPGQGLPELDVRTVPHAIRHATVFGALDSIRPGGGLILVAPHDPLPLLRQIERRYAGAFTHTYLERGPEAWRLRFVRQGG